MNLRDKLRAVNALGSHTANSSSVRQETGTVLRHSGSTEAPEPPRDCLHVETFRPAQEFPGAFDLTRETLALMSDLDLPLTFDPRRVLYLDTETTGLGGSGTVAFLVGLGWLTDAGFEVHQFLIRDYPEEPCLLRHVAEHLERFDLLCTFNGSTFDVPLLESRLLMNRMDRRCLSLPHLDLLHLSRRLWKLRLGRCNLSRLEEVILGQPRHGDLPGSEVPQRFFRFLKTGEIALLEDVLSHNAQDIVSLCVLLTHMANLYQHPEQIPFGEDVYAMGRSLDRRKKPEAARRCYVLARRGAMGTAAAGALAHSYRRAGEREQAARVWCEMVAERRGGVEPYVELAKYEEHVRRDPAAALAWTEKAMAYLAEPALRADPAVQDKKNALQYRWQRLKRKLKEL